MWTVARWEFVQNLKSKAFLIATFVAPIFSLSLIALVIVIARTAERSPETRLAVIDRAGIFAELSEQLRGSDYKIVLFNSSESELPARMQRGEFDGYLVIESDFFETRRARYVPKPRQGLGINIQELRSQGVPRPVREALSQILLRYELQQLGLPLERAAQLSQGIQITVQAAPEAATEQLRAGITVGVGFVIILLLLFITMNSITWIMYGVISEKRNRVVELVLSSIRARDLMAGKIVGLGGLALLQALIWAVVGLTIIFIGGPSVGLPTSVISLAILPFLAWEKILCICSVLCAGVSLLSVADGCCERHPERRSAERKFFWDVAGLFASDLAGDALFVGLEQPRSYCVENYQFLPAIHAGDDDSAHCCGCRAVVGDSPLCDRLSNSDLWNDASCGEDLSDRDFDVRQIPNAQRIVEMGETCTLIWVSRRVILNQQRAL
jgi:ABC-type Na+ efflux pump permease subunit